MNVTLLLLLALPILGAAFVYHQNRDKGFLPLISVLPGALLVALVFGLASAGATSDVEILNGQVTGKTRDHGTYEESYDCNCRTKTRTVGSGKNRRTETYQKCDTCYRTHYTVKWRCQTTLGDFGIDSEDSTSQSVYGRPDPQRYSVINKGDPVSQRHSYTNYVQAVPESLFATMDNRAKQSFAPLLVPYPDNVYDIYKIDRFMSPGFAFTDAAQWSQDISMLLRDVGPAKQVNLSVVIAKTADRQYAYALREHWEGANKNDVVLVIGSWDGQKIEFVDVISWTKNEIFKVQLIDRIRDIGIIERTQLLGAVHDQIAKNFKRRHMSEFKYLDEEIVPPDWVIWSLAVVLIIGYAVCALGLNGKLEAMYNRLTRRFK